MKEQVISIKFKKMIHKLSNYKKIVLYGAGMVAGIVYQGLKERDICVSACVVTKKDARSVPLMNGLPVHQIDDYLLELQKNTTVVLIAVSERYEKEMERVLQESGISNYLLISDYIRDNRSLLESYRNKTVQACIQEILEWCVDQNYENDEKAYSIKKELEEYIYYLPKIKNKIALVVGDLSPRVLKIARALYNKGKEVKIFIYSDALIREMCENELRELGIPYFKAVCVEELIYQMIMERPQIVHVFSCRNNTVVPYALIKMKSILPRIVYDEYDIINEFYYNYNEEWLEEERYCLEHADGVCHRGYELDYLSQKCNYQFQGKTIRFFDYCRDEDVTGQPNHTDTLTICYAGGLITEKEYPNSSTACWFQFAQQCAEAKCHLHVYPSAWSEERFAEYIELSKHNPYFHFHHPVPGEYLMQELSQYDYGTHPITQDFMQKEIDGFYRKPKMIYTVTNHFFDYLDAGIPIIAAAPVLFADYFKEREVLLPWTIENYDFDILRKKKGIFRQKVIKVQKELQMKNQIHKLIEFYENLL